ncbi:MAG: antitoxin [Verrucomicrobiae bacterium]
MSRISIDVTPHQHRQLKAIAALAGKSLKEFFLSRTLPHHEEEDAGAIKELEAFLEPRIQSARAGDLSNQSVSDIWKTIRKSAL